MICFYRYSEKGKDPKAYGYDFSKKDCFESFYQQFKEEEIILILDNCSKDSVSFFEKFKLNIINTNLGNSKSALFALNYSLEKFSNEIFYFAEDDYLYKNNSAKVLKEMLELCDYGSLYDHGDKYSNFNKTPNPLIKNFGENTILFRTENSHCKLTNSTTMTFAVKSEILKEDIDIFESNLQNEIPQDFNLFLQLGHKKRTLCTSVPGLSTHLSPDKDNLSPFFL